MRSKGWEEQQEGSSEGSLSIACSFMVLTTAIPVITTGWAPYPSAINDVLIYSLME